MKTLREYINEYDNSKRAIGHFNVATLDMAWAVFDAAKSVSLEADEKIPVIIGVSEGERDFMGISEIVSIVKNWRKNYDYPIFINADHTYSVERAEEAIEADFDMLVFDAAKESYEENEAGSKAVSEYRHRSGKDILIEAELGYIGSGSDIKDSLPEGVSNATLTDPKQAKDFVHNTGIDLLAPSVGNIHGMIKSGNPKLNEEHIAKVREFAGIPLVLHGGSGSSNKDFEKSINSGISIIHISTELRKTYHEHLVSTLETESTIAPYKYLKPSQKAIKEIIIDRIKLFSGLHNE